MAPTLQIKTYHSAEIFNQQISLLSCIFLVLISFASGEKVQPILLVLEYTCLNQIFLHPTFQMNFYFTDVVSIDYLEGYFRKSFQLFQGLKAECYFLLDFHYYLGYCYFVG